MPDTADLSCKELVELVTDYLENALASRERMLFDEHMALCHGCATYLVQMRLTITAVGSLSPETIDPVARTQLLEVFRTWKRR